MPLSPSPSPFNEYRRPHPSPHHRQLPTCQGPALFAPENRWRPFCSERCRMIDLGAWANDEYVVPGQPVEADDDIPPEGMRH